MCSRPFIGSALYSGDVTGALVPIVVSAAGCSFDIAVPAEVRPALVALLAPVALANVCPGEPIDRIEVRPIIGGSAVFVNDERFSQARSGAGIVRGVVSAISRRVLDHNIHLLHLHAGVVEINGHAVVVHGPSMVGKSTAVAALSQIHGARYGSDEMVAVDDRGTLTSWPKPVLLRAGGADVLGVTHELQDERTVPFAPWEDGSLVADTFDAALTLAVRYEPGATTHLRELTATEAALLLVEDCLDLARSEPVGLQRIARLVAQARTVELTHSMTPPAFASFVRELAEDSERPHREVELLDAVAAVGGVGHAPRTEAVRIGNEMIAHNYVTDAVVSLDEAGLAMWRSVDGVRQGADLPGGTMFIDQLHAHGLVAY